MLVPPKLFSSREIFDSLLQVFRCAGPPGLDLRPDPDLGANPAAEPVRGGDGGRHGRRGSDGGLPRVGFAKSSDQNWNIYSMKLSEKANLPFTIVILLLDGVLH